MIFVYIELNDDKMKSYPDNGYAQSLIIKKMVEKTMKLEHIACEQPNPNPRARPLRSSSWASPARVRTPPR